MENKNLLVVIPTYNESENISIVIPAVLDAFSECDILVVDDDSPDGTYSVVEKMATKNPRINLMLRSDKPRGLGRAYVDGFKWAIEKGYRYVLGMDADLSHDPAEIPNFYKELQVYDVVVGSRYINGIRILNWDLKRLFISQLGSLYARAITGLNLTDMTGGFNAYRVDVLKAIDLDKIESNGYAFQIELKFRAYVKGFKIKEIEIVFKERERGYSKMNKNIILEAMYECIKLRVKKILGLI